MRESVAARLRACGCVFAEEEARLLVREATTPDDLAWLVDRRAGGTPLEHVLGWAEFCGRRVAVDPAVFVPRRRSELVVRRAADLAPDRAVVVDLCCGSGAVGAVLGTDLHGAELHAVDVDAAAVRCARRNVGDRGRVYEGDLYAPLPDRLRGRVDVLVANPPYVPTAAMATLPAEARGHEPAAALDGGADGLDVVRRVAAGAPEWLAPDGFLVVESSEQQAADTTGELTRVGLRPEVARDADLGATVVVGTRSTSDLGHHQVEASALPFDGPAEVTQHRDEPADGRRRGTAEQ